jgi:hypothetical protein
MTGGFYSTLQWLIGTTYADIPIVRGLLVRLDLRRYKKANCMTRALVHAHRSKDSSD